MVDGAVVLLVRVFRVCVVCAGSGSGRGRYCRGYHALLDERQRKGVVFWGAGCWRRLHAS